MACKVILSSLALTELEESLDWYELRAVGLGERFVEVIDKALIVISLNPAVFPKKKAQYREFVVDTFPFVIVYEFDESTNIIYVLHIFHTRRNPKLKYKAK